MSRRSFEILLAAIAAVLVAVPAAAQPVGASGPVTPVLQFDPAQGQLPEGVAVDKRGDVYISLSPLGQLVRVPAGTSEVEPVGAVPGLEPGDIGLIGLAVDAPGDVYGAVVSANPDAAGVWRFDRTTGAAERVPGTGAIAFPNAVAFDKRGTMYVSDSVLGAVWRVRPGGVAEVWADDPLLDGNGSAGFGFPIGANGIAVRHGTLYVGVTETSRLVTIPIEPDGSAGTPTVFADLGGIPVDGIALDVHGGWYVAAPIYDAVLRVDANGTITELAAGAADGLDNPTSLAFGTGRGAREQMYAVNFSVALGTPLGVGPGLVSIDAGVPGWPLP